MDKNHPVQMIIAGKAHPQDALGKKIIQEIVNFAKDENLRNKIIFIENYDMNVAHYLVQGVDIWLNNPLRPQEASGTSGMKAALNGALNLSILDGWWCEGYNGENGWAIGSIDKFSDRAYQDDVDSRSIYDMLEMEIVPLYYARSGDGLPRGWIRKMKETMRSLGPVFNTNRMVEEYAKKFYVPSSLEFNKMKGNNFEAAKKKAAWEKVIAENWKDVKIVSSGDNMKPEMKLKEKAAIKAKIYLGAIPPEYVCAQIYSGYVDTKKIISQPIINEMSLVSKEGNDHIYQCDFALTQVGHCAYSIRLLPMYEGKVQYMPGFIIWS
jgi:starch phosphorylase